MNRRTLFNSVMGSGLALLVLMSASGCSWTGKKSTAGTGVPASPLKLAISLDKDAYQPGEAVIATVSLTNDGYETATVPPLQDGTLKFYFGPENEERRFHREPVTSPNETHAPEAKLVWEEQLERQFVFTRLADMPGTNVLTVMYDPSLDANTVPQPLKIVAEPVAYMVEGPRAVQRDSEGVLLKEEAIRLCTEEAGKHVLSSDALLVRNEAGFLDWWVVLELSEGANSPNLSDPIKKSWFVNPYLAGIRAEAQPFSPEMKKTKKNYRLSRRLGNGEWEVLEKEFNLTKEEPVLSSN